MQTLKLQKKYQQYPEYKDSGVEWLPKMPVGWELNKFKRLFAFQSGDGFPDTFQGNQTGAIPFMKVSDINGDGRFVDVANNYVELQTVMKNSWHLVPKDSILMAKIGAALEKNHRKVNKVGVCIDNNMLAIIPKKVLPEYGYWIWVNLNMKDFQNISSVPSVDLNLLRNYIYPVPDTETQKKLAEILNIKTALIDKIIEKKQKQIELLHEKRTAVINQAVNFSKGEFGRLKNFVSINPSKKAASSTKLTEAVSFVPMEAISESGDLDLQERQYDEVKEGFTFFQNEDVVLAKITPCFENGKAGVMKNLKNGFGFGTTEFIVLRPSNKILSDYLYYVVFSDKFRKLGEVGMRGSAGQKRVTDSFVRNFEINLPDIQEQKKVVDKLNSHLKIIDEGLNKIEHSVQYLKEFKSALISNAVTGKIKI